MLLAWTARSCTMEDMLSTFEDEVSLRTGRAVKQRREAAGFSLRMLAARSGISSSMISDIERGAKSPTVTTVVRLAQALGVTAAALIDGGTGPAPRIRVLRHGEGAGGEHPAPWESLGPAAPDSRIDFVRYQIPPSTSWVRPPPTHPARSSICTWPPEPFGSPWATRRPNFSRETAAVAGLTPRMVSRTPTRRLRR
jgi:transcriptional regulator with XRE-family HTH domain